VVEANPNVNIALKRPSWQSSVYCDRFGCHGAYKANDGSMVTQHNISPGCAHSVFQLNPWWAVDLVSPVYVRSVKVTSRLCCGAYFWYLNGILLRNDKYFVFELEGIGNDRHGGRPN